MERLYTLYIILHTGYRSLILVGKEVKIVVTKKSCALHI